MKIVTENLLVKVSKLVKDNAAEISSHIDPAQISQIEEIVNEIAGEGLVVEVTSLGFE